MGKLLCIVCAIALMCNVALADPRMWNTDGVPIRTGDHIRWDQVCVPRDDGSLLLIWMDAHTGYHTAYARALTADLEWSWAAEVPISSSNETQKGFTAIAVPGGWIVAWIENRLNHYNVYLQKFDHAGVAQWMQNGVVVDTGAETLDIGNIAIVCDNAGGALLVYSKHIASCNDIYAQRVDANGSLVWSSPLAVSVMPGMQGTVCAAEDGNGGALAAWLDERTTGLTGVYGARITPGGDLLWEANGRMIAQGSQSDLRVFSDSTGGLFLVWSEGGMDRTVYAQHVNSNGICLWDSAGVRVCTDPHSQRQFSAFPSHTNGPTDGLVLTWVDSRHSSFSEDTEIYAQKLDLGGNRVWPDAAIRLTIDADFCSDKMPQIVTDNLGGSIIGWVRSPQNFYANRLNAQGGVVWGAPGIDVTTGSAQQGKGVVTLDGAGNATMIWSDATGMYAGIRAQKLRLSDGTRLLGNGGQSLAAGVDGCVFGKPLSVSMLGHRAGIVWQDHRGATGRQIFYQVIDSSGHIERALHGDPITPATQVPSWIQQRDAVVCPDGSGGFFVACEQDAVIIFVHVDMNGNLVTPSAGCIVGGGWYPHIAGDGSGGCFVAFDDGWWPGGISVTRLNAAGVPVWTAPVIIPEESGSREPLGIVSGPDSLCTILWRGGGIFKVSRISLDGTIRWSTAVSAPPLPLQTAAIVMDNTNGAYIVWEQVGTSQSEHDIYAQHVDSTGAVTWLQQNGIAVAEGQVDQDSPVIAAANTGELYVVWCQDTVPNRTNLYAQKISAAGDFLWGTSGLLLATQLALRIAPALDVDGLNGIFVAWSDYHEQNSSLDVYGTHVDATGGFALDPYWTPELGGIICDAEEVQLSPSLAADGCGGWFVSWANAPYLSNDSMDAVYAQRIVDMRLHIVPRSDHHPGSIVLSQNYPNPFNSGTEIRFNLSDPVHVRISVFNTLGQSVATLVDDFRPAGTHHIIWDSRSASGVQVASGVYVYQIKAGSFVDSKKMLLIR